MLDLKYVIRQLTRSPGFTCVAVLTLGLCIGANLTIFTVLDAIVFRPLPFREPDRLVVVHNAYPATGIERGKATVGDYFDRRDAIDAFESVSMVRASTFILGEAGSTRLVEVGMVTPEFFQTLGVPLAMGRMFEDSEIDFGSGLVAILTDRFWRNYFDADPDVLGRTLMRDGLPSTVVGVLPPDFRYLSSKAEVYFALSHFPRLRRPPDRHSTRARRHDGQMIARLGPNRLIADAQAQMVALNAQLISDGIMAAGIEETGYHTWVAPLHSDYVRTVKPVLVLLQSAVLCLFLIGGVNLAGLLLIRASGREREIAVRKALGAGQWHLASKVLTETLMLSLGGGVCGVLLSLLGLRLVGLLGTHMLPVGADITLNGKTAIVSILMSIVLGVGIAIPLIWISLRGISNVSLQSETRSGTASRNVQHLRHCFIVAQIAMAFILLCGAGLLGASLKRTLENSPGFELEQVLTGEIKLPWQDYHPAETNLVFVRRLLDSLGAQPGVTHAAISTALPFTNAGDAPTTILTEATLPGVERSLRSHYVSLVTSDYLEVMGIPLLHGRFLEDSDSALSALRVAVIDEAFAEQYWPDGDAIGGRFSTNPTAFDKRSTYTVVGIVGKVKQMDLTETEELGAAYLPYAAFPKFQVIVRTKVLASAMTATLERVVRELDPNLPISDITTMQTRVDGSLVMRRSPAILAAVFAGVAMFLASIGTYGVLTYTVAMRRREIGVRIALGAMPKQIGRQFLLLAARLLFVGALLGCFGAWAAGRAMQHMLFEVPAFHLPTFAGAALVLSVVTFIACISPMLRATRIHPMEALRSD